MIHFILNILVTQLNQFIGPDAAEPPVVLGNIGLASSVGGFETYMQDKVVLSLVNIIEEATLKNTTAYQKINGRVEINTPPAFLNLFLLFSANFHNTQGSPSGDPLIYNNSARRLSQVISFFQNRRVFTVQNSPDPLNMNSGEVQTIIQNPELQNVRIKMELYSMTFEQVNHLWGSLGGKQVPFVMYKAWIAPVERELVTGRGALIQDMLTTTIHTVDQ